VNILSKVVLLVDDSQTVRRMIEWVLKPSGFRILHAVDGIHALEVLKAERVDLAFVDLNMPRMDGIELIRSVRSDKKLHQLPIILLTTENRTEDRNAAMEAGANLFLNKPSTPALLRTTAESILGLAASVTSEVRKAQT
jgi:two-component system chemotaxis response regulator CheY